MDGARSGAVTSFMVKLAESTHVLRIPVSGPLGRACRLRLLLVDASVDFLLAERSYFSLDERIQLVGHACTCEEAIDATVRTAPDLVIVDLLVPSAGGLELATRIRCLQPHATILVTAVREGVEYARAARAAGADGFVSKAAFCAEMDVLLAGLYDRRLAHACEVLAA